MEIDFLENGRSGRHRYRLSPHVFACRTADYAVLLDARSGEYFGVEAAVARALGKQVALWPVVREMEGEDRAAELEATHLVTQMLNLRMLTDHPHSAEYWEERVTVTSPGEQLIDGYERVECEIKARDIVRFSRAILKAIYFVNFRSIEALVAHTRRRRLEAMSVDGPKQNEEMFDRAYAQTAVAKFDRLFRALFSDAGRCLIKSVSLNEFLASCGLYPRCVIGVSTNPFAAHCWLQEGGIVVNDEPETVRDYTPILVI